MEGQDYWEDYYKRKVKKINKDKKILITFLKNKRSERVGYRRIIRWFAFRYKNNN